MKKFLFCLLTMVISSISVYALSLEEEFIDADSEVVYSISDSIWRREKISDDDIVLKKTLIEGAGSYSIYNYEDESLAFALATPCELIRNGNLLIVDNNLLKYYKLIYDGQGFEQVILSAEEVQKLFPEADLLRTSFIESDDKIWIHKPFLKKKTILLFNDTDGFYHQITCKSKNVQKSEIKGLLTIPRYGIIRFTHYGKRNGKLIFYVR